ncbi:thermonuclease family protein [Paenibacillus oceani]|uniref:Thermonuclease family protein n=1 Tax=Paenibacillus oceani TaxID=2772510 RepID=A0A927GZU3_9BACL|nr:thermonuclease family protein [Paenibacillus oceani]MBD2862608.1 thermonuclease family protein [Paenibacillus oceani]
MKPMVVWLWFTLILAGCAAPSGSGEASDMSGIWSRYPELKGQKYETTEVKRVVDGDTLETKEGDKVRLIGMNTPETVKPNSPVEAYGKEASAFSKKQLTGKTVYLFADAGDTDKYGRKLRYLFIQGESVMYNETLLREGYANTMTIVPNVTFAKTFVEAEREARNTNKGLWGKKGGNGESPNRTASCKEPNIKGNINSKNEKIYHVPGGKSYNQTKEEMLFCTEEEAEEAGFRKAG